MFDVHNASSPQSISINPVQEIYIEYFDLYILKNSLEEYVPKSYLSTVRRCPSDITQKQKVTDMNKILTLPLFAALVAFTAPAFSSAAYAQSTDTQQEEQQPKPETEKPEGN